MSTRKEDMAWVRKVDRVRRSQAGLVGERRKDSTAKGDKSMDQKR